MSAKKEFLSMSFTLSKRHIELLKRWANEDDRSVSATLRQILEREAQHRQGQEEQPGDRQEEQPSE